MNVWNDRNTDSQTDGIIYRYYIYVELAQAHPNKVNIDEVI